VSGPSWVEQRRSVRHVDVPTRLVVAEDSFIVREGVRMLLEEAGYEVAAVADDLDGLIEAVAAKHPDVVITDIRMPPTNTDEGVRAARQIRAEHPETGVVVLSQYVEPEYAVRLFEAGSAGLAYLLKERVGDLREMEAAIALFAMADRRSTRRWSMRCWRDRATRSRNWRG